jgi:very-short-patch-repair endonuclease
MCNELSLARALEVGMEFCGTYAPRSIDPDDKGMRDYQLMDAARFERHVNAWKGMHGLTQARVVAKYLANGSASPMETKLYLLLCLPQLYGGYNLARPELNAQVDTPEDSMYILRAQHIYPDELWRKAHVVVEYDGEYHNDPRQAARDELRRSILESMGYTVFVFKKQHVYNPLVFDKMVSTVAAKLGRRIRPLSLKQQLARERLREELLGSETVRRSR